MKRIVISWAVAVFAVFTAGYWAGQRSVVREIPPQPTMLAMYDQVFENGRTAAIKEVALCTLEAARREVCAIPCASDEDCLAKNGMKDH